MKRDFTQTTHDKLRGLLEQANMPWCDWSAVMGNWCLSHGMGEAMHALKNTEIFQRSLTDQNNRGKKDLDRVFEAVRDLDGNYGTRYKSHTESLRSLHAELATAGTAVLRHSTYGSSTNGWQNARITATELTKTQGGAAGSVGNPGSLGAKYMAQERSWVDVNGVTHRYGSAEAVARAAWVSGGQVESEIAGVTFDAQGEFFVGGEAYATAQEYWTNSGVVASVGAGGSIEASVEGSVNATFADGLAGAGLSGAASVGGRAKVDAGIALDPGQGKAGAHAQADAFLGLRPPLSHRRNWDPLRLLAIWV
ncbi:MAG: hypothetical protein LBU07_05510 [Coriobacteriales bacterium]|jgi:hypothetical protein|nr:hypothetical protein [Coriobacteriales bacterium]